MPPDSHPVKAFLLAMALQINLENIPDGAMNILSPECSYFSIEKAQLTFRAIGASSNLPNYFRPYVAVNLFCAYLPTTVGGGALT